MKQGAVLKKAAGPFSSGTGPSIEFRCHATCISGLRDAGRCHNHVGPEQGHVARTEPAITVERTQSMRNDPSIPTSWQLRAQETGREGDRRCKHVSPEERVQVSAREPCDHMQKAGVRLVV